MRNKVSKFLDRVKADPKGVAVIVVLAFVVGFITQSYQPNSGFMLTMAQVIPVFLLAALLEIDRAHASVVRLVKHQRGLRRKVKDLERRASAHADSETLKELKELKASITTKTRALESHKSVLTSYAKHILVSGVVAEGSAIVAGATNSSDPAFSGIAIWGLAVCVYSTIVLTLDRFESQLA